MYISGTVLGKASKGAVLRSQDPDREKFIQECPCQVSGEVEESKTTFDLDSYAGAAVSMQHLVRVYLCMVTVSKRKINKLTLRAMSLFCPPYFFF